MALDNQLQIVNIQTATACNGHCVYCPHDDIYGNKIEYMPFDNFKKIIEWLKSRQYKNRLGFLLHYEPTLDERLPEWFGYVRSKLDVSIEIATNGKRPKAKILELADEVKTVPAGSLKETTSRAGNCHFVEGIKQDLVFRYNCHLPYETMCITYTGEAILCCQDWRHEVLVGTVDDLDKARTRQLSLARVGGLELCSDCLTCKTAEEVGIRLGKRKP